MTGEERIAEELYELGCLRALEATVIDWLNAPDDTHRAILLEQIKSYCRKKEKT
jgi:hypothetical protein